MVTAHWDQENNIFGVWNKKVCAWKKCNNILINLCQCSLISLSGVEEVLCSVVVSCPVFLCPYLFSAHNKMKHNV